MLDTIKVKMPGGYSKESSRDQFLVCEYDTG